MIMTNRKTKEIVVEGTVLDLLGELAMITSEIEEMIAKKTGVDMAEKLVDGAINAGRAYNHAFVFKGKEDK